MGSNMMKPKRKAAWLPVIAVVGGLLLVVGGAIWFLWPRLGGSSPSAGGPAISLPLPPVLQQDTPEQAMENFLRAYQAGDFRECREWMTGELEAFYLLLGGLEAQWDNQHEHAGRLEGWELIQVYPAGDEAYLPGEVQILVRHIWEKTTADCVIYRMAPPDVTGDHWRLGGVYMFNAPCEGEGR